MEEERFWIVLANKPQLIASKRHESRESAMSESMRLANQHPGTEFYVAAVTGKAFVPPPVVQSVQWTELKRKR